MNLGQTISKLRKQRGLRQYELARAAQMNAGYLSLIEAGAKEPSLETITKIAEALTTPVPIIFFLSMETTDVPEHKRQVFEVLRQPILSLIETYFGQHTTKPERKRRTLTRQDLPGKKRRGAHSLGIKAFLKETGQEVRICDIHFADDTLCYLENANGIPTRIQDLEI